MKALLIILAILINQIALWAGCYVVGTSSYTDWFQLPAFITGLAGFILPIVFLISQLKGEYP